MPSALTDRIQACQKDLETANVLIQSEAVNSVLGKGVQGAAALSRIREDFKDRIDNLQLQLAADLAKDAAGKLPKQDIWAGFEEDRKNCSALLLECLAFYQGVLIRKQDLAGRVCSIADALAAELNEAARLAWKSFTLPADGESFASLAEIIRVRFPASDVWNLPITAHEFGHYAAGQLKARDPQTTEYPDFQSYLQEKTQSASGTELRKLKNHLSELFADVFGTYTLGPAFVRTCLLLRFSPGSADLETDDHPSYMSRAYLILKVLECMEKKCPEYSIARENGQNYWLAALSDAGKQGIRKNEELDNIARDLYRFLTDLAPHAEYKRWKSAQAVSAQFGSSEAVDKETTLADILNAAWMNRLAPGASPDKANEDAMRLCERK